MKAWAWLALIAVCLALLACVAYGLYRLGGTAEQAKTAQAEVKTQTKAKATTRAAIARADQTGHAREQDRAAIDTVFQQLAREAAHAPSAADDQYVLPDDRLRVWRAANAGRPDHGAAATQPDDGAAALAAAADRPHPGPGGEPHRDGGAVPPAGLADVPAAAAPADPSGGL